MPPERLGELNSILTGSAEDAGRDPGRLVRLYNVMGSITPVQRDLFHAPAGHWVETLTELYTSYQMNTFVFWPENDRERQSRVFAEDVVPAVRAALADAATSG